jgi:hypothetical protein
MRFINIFKCRVFTVILFFNIFTVAENSPSQTFTPSNSITLDTTGTSPHDTALSANSPVIPFSLVADTAQGTQKQVLPIKTAQPADTAARFGTHPFFSIGIGWGLGSFPLLTDWQAALPDSAGAILPVNPDTLAFKIKEPVNSYNILFPLYLSYTPFVYSRSSVAFEGSFFFIGKSIQASLQHDTLPARIDYKQSLSCFGFSIGTFYRRQLGERYFRIDKVDKTSFILGLSLLPYVGISKKESISSSGVSDSVVSAAGSGLNSFHAWGAGGSWRIGMCSQQTLSATSGMEISLSYIGRYMGIFRHNGTYVLNSDINPASENPGNKLSFLSNTFEIRLEFLIGSKKQQP